MEKIPFIVDRLKQPPFSMRIATMAEFDSKSSMELLDIVCEVLTEIDSQMADLKRDQLDNRIARIMQFLVLMKFNIPAEQMDHFSQLLNEGDKEVLHTIMHWTLSKFDHLQKRAYLARYLLPVEVSPEFSQDPLVMELATRLKEMQLEFKEVHKQSEQHKQTGVRPADLKTEIGQLTTEITQLQSKINKLKKESRGDEVYFEQMLKATSALRREQEEEARIYEKGKEQRQALQLAESRCSDTGRRLAETRSSGAQGQNPEELLTRLVQEVRGLADRKDALEATLTERQEHLEKLLGWENSDRVTTEDDVRNKRTQLRETERGLQELQIQLDAALERNPKLTMFRQASTMALTKLREREEAADKLEEERRRLTKQMDEREEEMAKARGKRNPAIGKINMKTYGAQVREKIEKYKKMRDELSTLRAELVVLQRTEQILKGKLQNLDVFLTELEKKKGISGYRDTQRELVQMTEATAAVDNEKGATLEQISGMVEQISREFKSKMVQVQPLMAELKALRQEFMDLESRHSEKKSGFDRVTVGLAVEQSNVEKECDLAQEECLREESRYHSLNCLVTIARIKLDRAEQEKKWQDGNGRMLRDFNSFKDLYAQKLSQQDNLTKQLRKRQKELKEDASVMSNQKTNFQNLHALLQAKSSSNLASLPIAQAEAVAFAR